MDVHAHMHSNNTMQQMLARECKAVELDALGKKLASKTQVREGGRQK